MRDIGQVVPGPDYRRGVAELDGTGETVSGIVVMRKSENAPAVIRRVKARLKEIESGLPPGMKIVPIYDRSEFIERSIGNLKRTIIEVVITVMIVILVFLRPSGSKVAPRSLPLRSYVEERAIAAIRLFP